MSGAQTEGEANSRPPRGIPFLSEGLLIAGATLIGYSLTFLYEYGYGRYFGIPADAIEVSLTTVLVTLGLLGLPLAWGVYLLIVANVWDTPSITSPASDPGQVLIAKLAPIVILTLLSLTFIVYADTWLPTLWMLVVLWSVALWLLLAPFAVSKKKKISFDEAVAEVHERQLKRRQLGYAFTRLVELGVYIPAALMVGLAAGAYFFGYYRAKAETDFLVNAEAPRQVVLRMYGNRLIAARLDREAQTVSRALTYMTLSESGVVLRTERVGPLTRASVPESSTED